MGSIPGLDWKSEVKTVTDLQVRTDTNVWSILQLVRADAEIEMVLQIL